MRYTHPSHQKLKIILTKDLFGKSSGMKSMLRDMLKFYIFQGLIILSGALFPIINLIYFPSHASNDTTPSPASGIKSANVSENKTGNGSNSE